MIARMFAACLIAAPAFAATLPYSDLVMAAGEDGRVMFRPADGVDVWGGKYEPVTLPTPMPMCMFPVERPVLASTAAPVWQAEWSVRTPHKGHTTGGGATGGWDEPPAPVPLPWSAALLLAALMGLGFWKRGRT